MEFLQQNHPSPADYILQLFETYDIVVLCERLHPESTQWDLIYQVIKDERFRRQVGHLFTEYGTVLLQPFLDEFMATEDLSQEAVAERSIHILRNLGVWPVWQNANFDRFLKRLYALNQSLDAAERVQLHFSDIPFNWDGMTTTKYQLLKLTAFVRRDKTMADQIEAAYKAIVQSPEPRKKCLVIMNYRHAFGPIRDRFGRLRGNTAEYLFEAFPGQVANVLLNTLALDLQDNFVPIHNGLWDGAFKEAGHRPVGFDLAGSPFGQDPFDLFPFVSWIEQTCKYKDVFTGVAFYNPVEEFVLERGVHGLYHGFEEEILRRARCIGSGYHETIKREVDVRRQTPVERTTPWAPSRSMPAVETSTGRVHQ